MTKENFVINSTFNIKSAGIRRPQKKGGAQDFEKLLYKTKKNVNFAFQFEEHPGRFQHRVP